MRYPATAIGVPSSNNAVPDDIDVFVGQRLRAFRMARRRSMESVSLAIGVSYQQLQKYEHGKNRVSASMLWRLAEVLDVGIEDLFPASDGRVPDAASIRTATALSRMDKTSREIMADLIDAIASAAGKNLPAEASLALPGATTGSQSHDPCYAELSLSRTAVEDCVVSQPIPEIRQPSSSLIAGE